MTSDPIRVDIISDVVCPWCIVGFRQLEQASRNTGIQIEPYWHPFELNPDMVPEGENLKEHIMRKYGSTAKQSEDARAHLSTVGAQLNITFNWTEESRIYNTFKAHQLLHWASTIGQTHRLKLALFDTYFTDGRDVSDEHVLLDVIDSLGLDVAKAQTALDGQTYAQEVRKKQFFWTSRGVSGVPTMILGAKQATSGAQGVEAFTRILTEFAGS
ncbi:DsbA family oxidoreductase [Shimia sp. R11_0]|uniref:DsbA family oxidoreductase n=1 Tax=Shimia sp. R11_0 TaxID=2821096 RepID=UPI001ADD4386|nr:DsbA family oxidoreductase [Shimia sp. R11_0]